MKQTTKLFMLISFMSIFSVKTFSECFEVVNSDGITIYYEVIYSTTSINTDAKVTCYDFYGQRHVYYGNVNIPESVTYQGHTYRVTGISSSAFKKCSQLTSVTMPNTITNIGRDAFKGCTSLSDITLSNSLLSIDCDAFYGCSQLMSIRIPNSVEFIGSAAFRDTGFFNNSPNGLFYVDNWICDIKGFYVENSSLVIPEGTIGIAQGVFLGFDLLNITLPNSLRYIDKWAFGRCDEIVLPDNILYIGEDFVPWYTTIICKEGSATLLSLWEADYLSVKNDANETLFRPYLAERAKQTSLSYRICQYYSSYKYSSNYELTNDIISVTDLFPEESVDVELVISTNDGKKEYKIKTKGTTLKIGPFLQTEIGPTFIKVKGYYKEGDAIVTRTQFHVNDKPLDCDSVEWKGLDPRQTQGVFKYGVYVTSEKRGTRYYQVKETVNNDITLMLNGLQPKVIAPGDVIIAAETNITNDDENVGFEWRRTDWTDEFQSKKGTAYLYEGAMEGFIRSLNTEKLWKYRAYYESSAGNRYYGDWIGIDPTDVSYFEPTVHTYSDISVEGNTANVRGYAQRGTDDITSQGFKYWEQEAGSRSDVYGAVSVVPNNAITLESSGTIMKAELRGLKYSTNYCYVAFVKTSEGETYYGKTRTFSTGIDSSGIQETTNNNVVSVQTEVWFDMRGQMLDKPKRGLNIVVQKDGKVKKMIVK